MTTTTCWVPGIDAADPFGINNLPYGAASVGDATRPRLVVRIGDFALDLAAACRQLRPDLAGVVDSPVLNPLLATDAGTWRELRRAIREWLSDGQHRTVIEALLLPLDALTLHLPIEVADYVDFFASVHHARNAGAILRPQTEALNANWKHLPVGYHGRAGTVVVSGTPIQRPAGQWRTDAGVQFGPSQRLDFEAEVGFVLGAPTSLGSRVPLGAAGDHIFGVCLLNDWSARDIQAWEAAPLGPFLGKSFGTSISGWITPLEALAGAAVEPPVRDTDLLAYLDDGGLAGGLAIELTVRLNGSVISRPRFADMYWTPAQLLAHLTVNGASIRAGDLLGSGTVSGPERGQRGCLLELSWGATVPIELPDGTNRTYLLDGDEVRLDAVATIAGSQLALGEVIGRVRQAEV